MKIFLAVLFASILLISCNGVSNEEAAIFKDQFLEINKSGLGQGKEFIKEATRLIKLTDVRPLTEEEMDAFMKLADETNAIQEVTLNKLQKLKDIDPEIPMIQYALAYESQFNLFCLATQKYFVLTITAKTDEELTNAHMEVLEVGKKYQELTSRFKSIERQFNSKYDIQ